MSVASGLRRLSKDRDEFAGIPMPLNGEQLVIDPSYRFANALSSIGLAVSQPRDEEARPSREFRCHIDDGAQPKHRNTFWSWKFRCNITIWEDRGKFKYGIGEASNHLAFDMHTVGCSDAWSIETELTAMSKLRELVSHRKLRQYMLTGMFIETSKRSGIKYIFRRLRPTVAVSEHRGELKILCCLCLHPIAYYHESWAGAMCPTDDVIAHLMLMRGDEHMYWKRANQHPPERRESGL